jgi:hypothetical protein
MIPSVQPVEKRVPQRLTGDLQLIARTTSRTTSRLGLDDPDVACVLAVRTAIRLRLADLVKSRVILPPEQRHCRNLGGLRQLRQDLLDAPQKVRLIVPEVVEERLQSVANEPKLLLGEFNRVHGARA